MSTPMHLSFQLKKSKADDSGKSPIYARITIDNLRTEFSIKRSVESSKWVSKVGIVKGSNEEGKSNAFLNTVRFKLNEQYRQLMEAGRTITPEIIKNGFLGIKEKGENNRRGLSVS